MGNRLHVRLRRSHKGCRIVGNICQTLIVSEFKRGRFFDVSIKYIWAGLVPGSRATRVEAVAAASRP